MRFFPYSLDAKDDCPAAFAAVLESGHLVCQFDGRAVVFSVPTPRNRDIRLVAVDTLRNRHRLNDAFLPEQEGYSGRLTLAAVKARLQVLVDRGQLAETLRNEELQAIAAKFKDLQTTHDWQRYLSVSQVAKAHLDKCLRTGGDFEKFIAPRLANYIETDYHQEQSKVGLGMIEPRVPGTVTVCSKLAGFLQSVGWKPQAPSDVVQTAVEVLTWCDDSVKQRDALRADLDKRNATLRYVPEAEDLLRKQLDLRDVPWDKDDNVSTLAFALGRYLSDVERYAVKRWHDVAMRALETLKSAEGKSGYTGVLSDMAITYRRNTAALLQRAGEMHREVVSKLEATIVDLTAKIAGMEAQVELCLADDLQLKPTIERLTAENDALKAQLADALSTGATWQQATLELDRRVFALLKAVRNEQRLRQEAQSRVRSADELSKSLLDQLEASKAKAAEYLGRLQQAETDNSSEESVVSLKAKLFKAQGDAASVRYRLNSTLEHHLALQVEYQRLESAVAEARRLADSAGRERDRETAARRAVQDEQARTAKARDEAVALAARLDKDLIASNLHLRRVLDEQGQAKQIVANWSAAQADWKAREATLVERLRELEEERDGLAERNAMMQRINSGAMARPVIANVIVPPPLKPSPVMSTNTPTTETPRKVRVQDLPKTALNAHMAARRLGLTLDRFRQLVHDRRGPKASWRAGAGRGGALWYTESDIDVWAAQRGAPVSMAS